MFRTTTTTRTVTRSTVRRVRLAAVAAATACSFAAAAPALAAAPAVITSGTLYASTFAANSQIDRISPATGARTVVGTAGVRLTDLSFRGSTLYGISFTDLYAVSTATGQARHIGSTGLNTLNALITSPSGVLYGATADTPARFVTINPTTGAARQVGWYGTGISSAGDLTYFGGKLYATVHATGRSATWLATVNTTTGQATLIGNTGYAEVWGLTTRAGVLYGATNNGKFLKLSPSTGHGTLIGSNGLNQSGLATAP